ncbi:MAG: hypothetical protein AAF399_25975 [Bacteroidota bacterium]
MNHSFSFARLSRGGASLAMIGLLFIVGCKEEPPIIEPEQTIDPYTVVAAVGDEEYMTTTTSLDTGSISIVGSGVETLSYGTAVSDGVYKYIINYDESTVDQYEITLEGLQKIASLAMGPLSPAGSFRLMQLTPDGDLLLMNWPDDNGDCPFAIATLPDFTVKSQGSFNIPDLGQYDPVEIGGVIKGDNIYLGAMYSKLGSWDIFPDSLITWKLDYPSFTNPEMMVSTASLGTVAGFSGPSAIIDEQGDIYQQNIRSKHWYNMGTREDMPSVFVRIKNGTYDDSYVFNLSDEFPGTISLIGIIYAGNGIAYGKLLDEDATNEWGDAYAGNFCSIVKIDLYNQTVTELNLPQGPYISIADGLIDGNTLYLPINPTGQDGYVYAIEIGGGADDFTKGAKLDGNNVVTYSLFKNE